MTKKAARPPRRLMITKNLILMLVVVVIVFLAVFAWYYENTTVTATGTTISAQNPEKIQIALPYRGSFPMDSDSENGDFKNTDGFKESVNFSLSEYFVTPSMFKDVTSDGKTFILPTFDSTSSEKDGRTVIPAGEWTKAQSSKEVLSDDIQGNEEDYNYVSLDFYLRSPNPEIKVKASSYVKTYAEAHSLSLYGTEASVTRSAEDPGYDKDYGTSSTRISDDAVAGALRMSLVGATVTGRTVVSATKNADTYATVNGKSTWDDTATSRFVWLPRPDLLLNTAASKSAWTLSTGVTATNDKAPTTYRHSFYTPSDINVPKNVVKHTWYDSDLANDLTGTWQTAMTADAEQNTVFHVSKGTSATENVPQLGADASIANETNSSNKVTFGQEEYYVYKMTLNIWIEGEDKEARRALVNGIFNINLEFGQ